VSTAKLRLTLRSPALVSPACSPISAANAVAEGKLKIVLAAYEPEPLPINLVHVGQSLLPLKTRAFLDFVAPRSGRE